MPNIGKELYADYPERKVCTHYILLDIGNTSTYIPLKYILFHRLLRLLETSCKLLESNCQTTILITKNCHLILYGPIKVALNFIENNTLPMLAQPIRSLINVLHWMPCSLKTTLSNHNGCESYRLTIVA